VRKRSEKSTTDVILAMQNAGVKLSTGLPIFAYRKRDRGNNLSSFESLLAAMLNHCGHVF